MLKRSGFKQLTYAEALEKKHAKQIVIKEKSLIKKPKKRKTDYKKLQERVWQLCREIKGLLEEKNCYTCNATNLVGVNCQLGHGKAKGSLSIKYQYDLRNLHWQCFNCNINLGGMSDIFIAKMEKTKDGLEFLKETCYQENGYWKLKQSETISGIDFLTLYEQKLIKLRYDIKSRAII